MPRRPVPQVSSPLNLAFLDPHLNHKLRKLVYMFELKQGVPHFILSFGAKCVNKGDRVCRRGSSQDMPCVHCPLCHLNLF